ncbi:hypothetical protein ACLOJK_029754 [Asimina triloba]
MRHTNNEDDTSPSPSPALDTHSRTLILSLPVVFSDCLPALDTHSRTHQPFSPCRLLRLPPCPRHLQLHPPVGKGDPTHAVWYANHTVLYGFAAALEASEAKALRLYQSHTTRTPNFLGLNANSGDEKQAHFDKGTEDIITGLLDTGVWPQSPSFDDRGMPAIPLRWRDKCERGPDFGASACNKKLIFGPKLLEGSLPRQEAAGENLPLRSKRPRNRLLYGPPVAPSQVQGVLGRALLRFELPLYASLMSMSNASP